jgi:hypothetical protein
LGPETRKRKMENQETTTHFVNLPVGPGCHHWSLKKDMFTASLTWWSDQACELQAGWQTEDWTESMAIQVWHKWRGCESIHNVIKTCVRATKEVWTMYSCESENNWPVLLTKGGNRSDEFQIGPKAQEYWFHNSVQCDFWQTLPVMILFQLLNCVTVWNALSLNIIYLWIQYLIMQTELQKMLSQDLECLDSKSTTTLLEWTVRTMEISLLHFYCIRN